MLQVFLPDTFSCWQFEHCMVAWWQAFLHHKMRIRRVFWPRKVGQHLWRVPLCPATLQAACILIGHCNTPIASGSDRLCIPKGELCEQLLSYSANQIFPVFNPKLGSQMLGIFLEMGPLTSKTFQQVMDLLLHAQRLQCHICVT